MSDNIDQRYAEHDHQQCIEELAAERARADRLARIVKQALEIGWTEPGHYESARQALAEHRKARGEG